MALPLPRRPQAQAIFAAIRAGDAALLAQRHARAKASYASALKLTDKLPTTNGVRALALAREVSRQVGAYVRDCLAVQPMYLKALARWEKARAARARALVPLTRRPMRAGSFWITITMLAEYAALYTGFSYGVQAGYVYTKTPRRVVELGAEAVEIYHAQVDKARWRKVWPVVKEVQKLLTSVRLRIENERNATQKRLRPWRAFALAARALLSSMDKMPFVLTVKRVRRVGLVPAALRGPPRGGEAQALPLRTSAGLRPLSALLGPRRTLLVIARCHRQRGWMAALGKLAEDYRRIGLKVAAVAVSRCAGAPQGRGFWRAGPLLPWALEVQPDSAVVLDDRGAVLWRQRLRAIADAGPTASAWLESWPAFALAKRQGAPTPKAALARRLTKLKRGVDAALKRGRTDRALKLARRAAKLAPQSAGVQRQLALAAGHARDLGTVTDRTRWWRQRYGDLAAELLLDRVRRETGVPKLADPGRATAASPTPPGSGP